MSNSPPSTTARGVIYRSLAELFLHADTEQPSKFLKTLPQLQGGWEATANKSSDRWAADFYRTLGTNVFPFARVYLDPEASIGGTLAEAVQSFYESAGYLHDRTHSESPDHIGHELTFLGWLCSVEEPVQHPSQSPQSGRQRELQRRFLDLHLLRWIFVFAQALRMAGHPFYEALANVTFSTLLDHRRELSGGSGGAATGFQLPDPPQLLDKDSTDLREIASYLLTPAYSGFFLSRDAILQLAESQELSCGFGDRRRMLANLLHAAVQYDSLAGLVSALEHVLTAWDTAYIAYADFDKCLASIGTTWRERLAHTLRLMDRLGSAAI